MTPRAPTTAAGAPPEACTAARRCTLCDVAKELLASAAEREPHTLQAVDITDADRQQWWRRYKYDIPVLHIDGKYWAKHKITLDEAIGALGEARAGRCARVPQAPRPLHPASSLPGPQHSVIVADVARFGNLNAARPLTLSSLADAFSAAPICSQVGRPAGRAGC